MLNTGGNQPQGNRSVIPREVTLPERRSKHDVKVSLGVTPYFVLGETFAWAKSGSYQTGVTAGSPNTAYAQHHLALGFDAAVDYRLSDSPWRINTFASYLHSKTEPEGLTVGNDYLPAFALSDLLTDVGEMRAASDLHRLRLGVDGRYAFIDTKYNNLNVDLGLNFGSIKHDLDISAPVSGLIQNRMAFHGAGPRVGVSALHRFKNGLGFAGGLGTTLLTGYGTMLQEHPYRGSTTQNVSVTEDDWRVVPMADIKVATTFDSDVGSYSLGGEFGLRAEYWTNLPEWYSPTHYSVNPSKTGADNMTFLGPYFEFNAKF